MAPRNQVRFVHQKVEETVLVARQGGDGGGVPATAARGYDQHDRARQGQARPFDPEALGAGGVEGQGGGG